MTHLIRTDSDKNKLAADYITVPLMINFNFAPDKRKNFGFSAGVSARLPVQCPPENQVDGDVDKTKSDFDLLKWKLSYIGEISLGPVKLYGSYAFKSMFEKELDLTPYNVGLAFQQLVRKMYDVRCTMYVDTSIIRSYLIMKGIII